MNERRCGRGCKRKVLGGVGKVLGGVGKGEESSSRKEQKVEEMVGGRGYGESKLNQGTAAAAAGDDDDDDGDDVDNDVDYNGHNNNNNNNNNNNDNDTRLPPTFFSPYPSGLPILPNESRDLSTFLLHASYEEYRQAVWTTHGESFDR